MQLTPYRLKAKAAVAPAGPTPTTKTSVSMRFTRVLRATPVSSRGVPPADYASSNAFGAARHSALSGIVCSQTRDSGRRSSLTCRQPAFQVATISEHSGSRPKQEISELDCRAVAAGSYFGGLGADSQCHRIAAYPSKVSCRNAWPANRQKRAPCPKHDGSVAKLQESMD
jgi:hypothetical protein